MLQSGKLLFIQFFYTGNLFWFSIFGYGLRFDRTAFVSRLGSLYNAHFISIGKWDVELLQPRNRKLLWRRLRERYSLESIPCSGEVAKEFGFSGFSKYIRR